MRILHLEPWGAGSHAAFCQTLEENVPADWTVLTLPGRHWKWRARGAASYFALEQRAVLNRRYDLLLAGSYLSLAELLGLQPQLALVPRILYFHENQLAYPVREALERDLHFGFSQLVSALAATRCAFNSQYNRDSFLEAGRTLLERLPDAVPHDWITRVENKSVVLPIPLALPDLDPDTFVEPEDRKSGPILLWNHRWEHDKGPELFFAALERLAAESVPFRLIVCGEQFREAPAVFAEAKEKFGEQIIHFGYASRDAYPGLLARAQIAISTAQHEFFGISMVEATHFGARPLVPNRLSYPEIFGEEYRYEEGELAERLADLCRQWQRGTVLRRDRRQLTKPFGTDLFRRYGSFFEEIARLV